MSLVDWYLYKADQYSQMAQDATDPLSRANYEETQEIWLALAKQTGLDEESQSGKKPN